MSERKSWIFLDFEIRLVRNFDKDSDSDTDYSDKIPDFRKDCCMNPDPDKDFHDRNFDPDKDSGFGMGLPDWYFDSGTDFPDKIPDSGMDYSGKDPDSGMNSVGWLTHFWMQVSDRRRHTG